MFSSDRRVLLARSVPPNPNDNQQLLELVTSCLNQLLLRSSNIEDKRLRATSIWDRAIRYGDVISEKTGSVEILVQVLKENSDLELRRNLAGALRAFSLFPEGRKKIAQHSTAVLIFTRVLEDSASDDVLKEHIIHTLVDVCMENDNLEPVFKANAVPVLLSLLAMQDQNTIQKIVLLLAHLANKIPGSRSIIVDFSGTTDPFDGVLKRYSTNVLINEQVRNLRNFCFPVLTQSTGEPSFIGDEVKDGSIMVQTHSISVAASPVLTSPEKNVPDWSSPEVWGVDLRPANVRQATTSLRAAEGCLPRDESQSAREYDQISINIPSSDGKMSGDSAGSERDGRGINRPSLFPVINTIAFSELALEDILGRGGFGEVRKATWNRTTPVAVKQLIGRLTEDLLEEFQRETAVHAGLRHPNILSLYGVCTEPMRIAMVIEFMAQGSLYDVLRRPAELPWSLRLSFALDMAAGLLYLHGQRIIHRDLKSLNILVDGQNRAKISDFGLSKIKLTTASMTKGGAGTPHWMAPELFNQAPNSKLSDVYATGIVFWEIAAKALPYKDKNPMQIALFVNRGNRETIPAGTPESFADLITRCWAQRTEDRPSMDNIARDLRAMSVSSAARVRTENTSPTVGSSSSLRSSLKS